MIHQINPLNLEQKKSTILKSSLYDYSDAYILVKGKIIITGARVDAEAGQAHEREKGVSFKYCSPSLIA